MPSIDLRSFPCASHVMSSRFFSNFHQRPTVHAFRIGDSQLCEAQFGEAPLDEASLGNASLGEGSPTTGLEES